MLMQNKISVKKYKSDAINQGVVLNRLIPLQNKPTTKIVKSKKHIKQKDKSEYQKNGKLLNKRLNVK